MIRIRYLAVLAPLVAVLVAAACSPADDEEQPQAASESFAEHMHGHLVHVDAIKAGVIAGNLGATREHAVWLSEHDEPPGMPAAWSPYVKEMRQYAAVAAAARDLDRVAVAVSEIGRTCGECHRTSGAQLQFAIDPRPPADAMGVSAQMHRHLWAAERMWESLLGPEEEFWQNATDLLATVDLAPDELSSDPVTQEQVADLLSQARTLGEEGARTAAGPARSELLGQYLSLCASCHALTGGGPG